MFLKSPFVLGQGLNPSASEVYRPQRERESSRERDREPSSLLRWEPMLICQLYLATISSSFFLSSSSGANKAQRQMDSASVQA